MRLFATFWGYYSKQGLTKATKLSIFVILQTNPRLGKMRIPTILPSRFFYYHLARAFETIKSWSFSTARV